jgi:hypothetical protein
MKMLSRHAVLVALISVLSACHQQDAWETVLSQIHPDGSVSKDTALAAFVLAIGPLPGVPTPSGSRSYIHCGSLAVDWVKQYESELTVAQQQAVRQYLGPAPAPRSAAPDMVQQKYQALADIAAIKITAQLSSLNIPTPSITVVIGAQQKDAGAGAFTNGFDASGAMDGPQATCKITIEPLLFSQSDRVVAETIPHEVFHCFVNSFFSTLEKKRAAPDWTKEGPAEWVGDTIAGHADNCQTCWQHYLTVPPKSLYQRSYDALGFFAEMNADGFAPWTYFPAIPDAFERGGNAEAFTALTQDDKTFVDTWATSFVRKPELGGEWDITGPGITTDKFAPQPITVAAGTQAGEAIQPAANNDYLLFLRADVVIINTPDHSRLHAESPAGFASTNPRGVWCTLSSGCSCPAGSAHAGETLATIPQGSYYLAVSGAANGTQWEIQGLSLTDYCNSSVIDPCLFGVWTANKATIFDGLTKLGCTIPDPFGATFTVNRDGTSVFDFSGVPTIMCGPDQSFKFGGQSPGKIAYANHGLMNISGDLSSITIDETVQGVDLGPMSVGMVLGAGTNSDFTSYQCGKSSLVMTNSTGQNTNTFSR